MKENKQPTEKPQNRFKEILKEETALLRKQIAEDIQNLGDPMDVTMNPNDKLADSDGALVYKDPSGKKVKSTSPKAEAPISDEGDATDATMNQEPSKEGHDEKISTAVEVKAGAKKGGGEVTAGQAATNFTSKKGNPNPDLSDPFNEGSDEEMNKMDTDKSDSEAPKTFVESGAKKGGTDVTAGQHAANWKESAPDSDKDARIADGIQLKEKYTKTELKEFILEQANKIARKKILEIQMKSVKKELENL